MQPCVSIYKQFWSFSCKKYIDVWYNRARKKCYENSVKLFGFLIPNEMPNIKFDLYTAKNLKEMDDGS